MLVFLTYFFLRKKVLEWDRRLKEYLHARLSLQEDAPVPNQIQYCVKHLGPDGFVLREESFQVNGKSVEESYQVIVALHELSQSTPIEEVKVKNDLVG